MKLTNIATIIIACSTAVFLPLMHASPAPSAANGPDTIQQVQRPDANGNNRLLATQYREKERLYRAKATEEKIEWDRRKQITGGIAEKYPRPVDSSRNLYEYYNSKAEEMGKRALEYETRAGLQNSSPA